MQALDALVLALEHDEDAEAGMEGRTMSEWTRSQAATSLIEGELRRLNTDTNRSDSPGSIEPEPAAGSTDDDTCRRQIGCQCMWEEGDSPCPIHGLDEDETSISPSLDSDVVDAWEAEVACSCKLCGKPRLSWQVFCGAACCARYEAGERARMPA